MKKSSLYSLFSILLVCSCVSISKHQRLVGGNSPQAPTTGGQTLANYWTERDTIVIRDTMWEPDYRGQIFVDSLRHGLYYRSDKTWVPLTPDTASIEKEPDSVQSAKIIPTEMSGDTAKLRKWGRQTGQQFMAATVTTSGTGIAVWNTITGRITPRDTFKVDRIEYINDSIYIFKDSTRQLKALFSRLDSLKSTVASKTTEVHTYHTQALYYLWWAVVSTIGLLTFTLLYFFRWRD